MLNDVDREDLDLALEQIDCLFDAITALKKEYAEFKASLDIAIWAMGALNEMNGDGLDALTKYLGVDLRRDVKGAWVVIPKEN